MAVNFLITILVLVLLLGGVVCLQIFLSKRKNKWVGLILPIICFLLSLLPVISIPAYHVTSYQVMDERGNVIEEKKSAPVYEDMQLMVLQIMIIFVLSNIPTGILVGIYISYRENMKKNLELEKMNIQDLE